MSKLIREMKMLAKHAGGSFKTVHDRTRIIDPQIIWLSMDKKRPMWIKRAVQQGVS